LVTAATRAHLGDRLPLISIPPQRVKGKEEPLELFAVELVTAASQAKVNDPANSNCAG
jgi:hypothetical protein